MTRPEWYEKNAVRWDAMLAAAETWLNHEEAARRFHWFMKRAIKIGNRTKSYRMLDLGAGTGEASWPLWKRVQSTTFLDRSEAMLRLARNKYPKGIFVRGDATALPFLDAEFDVVVSRGQLISQHDTRAEVDAILQGVWRTLRPGGLFLLDFVANRESWAKVAPPELARTFGWWNRGAMEQLVRETLPEAAILAYDGTETHAVNRILLKKPV